MTVLEWEVRKLADAGIDLSSMGDYDLLCLPENAETARGPGDLIDASDSANFSKYAKAAGAKCANSFDLSLGSSTIDRRSSEVWLGLLWLLGDGAWPFVISATANMFTDRVRAPFGRGMVHVKIRWGKGGKLQKLDFDGDPAALLEVLKALKVSQSPED